MTGPATRPLEPADPHLTPMSGPAPYSASAFLAEGSVVEIRSVTAADLDALVDLHARASDESIRRRFFALNRVAAARYAARMCAEQSDCLSLVAVQRDRLVGVVSADRDGADSAEVALLVEEGRHGLGIGTVLLEHLAAWTYGHRIDVFHAEVLSDNVPMLHVFRDAGFDVVQRRDQGVVTVTLDVRPTNRSRRASDQRERQAERASLRHLFEPSAVAVVGVSRRRGGIGREILENLKVGAFDGRIVAVGHAGLAVVGVEVCAGVDELPEGLDLAVVAVPAAQVLTVVQGLASLGTRVCVIVTSGLAETGDVGRRTEQAIADVAHRAGMRVVGPNCFGVLSRVRGVQLDATFGTQHPRAGRLAIGSQSGGVGIALLAQANRRDLGLASFVSLGNKLDVSGNDLLAAWEDDPDVGVAALYLESFGNPNKFVRLAASFGRSKPLLAVFGGTSAAGRRGGASHTAASATPRRALDAVFRASGVVQVDGITDLVDTAALFSEQPLPQGVRVAVVSNAGGLGVLAADAAQVDLLTVPALGEDLQRRITAAGAGVAGASNPVDLGAGASPSGFGTAVSELLGSDEIDALLVVVAATAMAGVDEVVAAVDEAVERHHVKPCALVVIGDERGALRGPATRFESAEVAIRSLRHATHYASWRHTANDAAQLPDDAITPVADATRTSSGAWIPPRAPGWLSDEESTRLLASSGIRVVEHEVVHHVSEVVAAVDRLGLPLVAKTAVPGVVHKIERSLVRTNLTDGEAVCRAVGSIQADCPGPVLLQQQVAGPEIAVGVVRDAGFGPLVMVASGGTNLSLWDDQTFLLPPISTTDALEALGSLRTWPLLTGYRGGQALDAVGVAQMVRSVGQLALDWPQVEELDLNPLIVTPAGPVCVDAKVRWADLGTFDPSSGGLSPSSPAGSSARLRASSQPGGAA